MGIIKTVQVKGQVITWWVLTERLNVTQYFFLTLKLLPSDTQCDTNTHDGNLGLVIVFVKCCVYSEASKNYHTT